MITFFEIFGNAIHFFFTVKSLATYSAILFPFLVLHKHPISTKHELSQININQ